MIFITVIYNIFHLHWLDSIKNGITMTTTTAQTAQTILDKHPPYTLSDAQKPANPAFSRSSAPAPLNPKRGLQS